MDLDDTFTEHLWYDLPCPLGDGPYGEEIPSPGGGDECFPESAVSTETDLTFQIGSSTVTGATGRRFTTLTSSSLVVRDIGLVFVGVGDPDWSYTSELRYARIGDQEFGEAGFAFPNSADSAPAASSFTVRLGPNPSAGAVQLSVTGALPGRVRAEVFDLLGRRVAVGSTATTGGASMALDLRSEAPGLYVVRVSDGEQVLTRRVTVAR